MVHLFKWLSRLKSMAGLVRGPRVGYPRLTPFNGLILPASEAWREKVKRMKPLAPYSILAKCYYGFSQSFCRSYEDYLVCIADRYRFTIVDVLDLACGAGTLTVRLAQRFPSVTGIDVNEAMLESAKVQCGPYKNVRIEQGDFQSFELGRAFDAVVCASDSLNYVASTSELKVVFQHVAKHLKPGGFFLFDVLGSDACRAWSWYDYAYEQDGIRFAMCSEFDEESNRDTTYVVFHEGVEIHTRKAIDVTDVTAAATAAGLQYVDDLDGWNRDARALYALRRV